MINDNQNNYDKSTIKVGTFFSGIDKNTIKSYCVIHNIDDKLNKGSILSIKG